MPLTVSGVVVKPGDIIFCDVDEGVIVIPHHLLDDVVKALPDHVKAEEGIKYAINNGLSVSKAFSLWR